VLRRHRNWADSGAPEVQRKLLAKLSQIFNPRKLAQKYTIDCLVLHQNFLQNTAVGSKIRVPLSNPSPNLPAKNTPLAQKYVIRCMIDHGSLLQNYLAPLEST
jgi:hypothetical protein